ncbi:MAG: hypothetical protein ACI9MS_003252, partial [Glaciecola sp.]
ALKSGLIFLTKLYGRMSYLGSPSTVKKRIFGKFR